MKGEIRARPFIPTVKIAEYFTLLSQLSLPPPVASPRRWKRRRDEADLLRLTPTPTRAGSRNLWFATSLSHSLSLSLLPTLGYRFMRPALQR